MSTKQNTRKNQKNNQKKSNGNGPTKRRASNRLLDAGLALARKVPVIGNIVDTVDTVASTICNFLGLESSLFSVTYGVGGVRSLKLHSSLADEKSTYSSTGTAVPGDILMKVFISPGPEGSRSRVMAGLYEKIQYKSVQISVMPTCAATEPGQLAFVYVPDPADSALDLLPSVDRIASVLARENVRIAQIWQSTTLNFPVPQTPYYVSMANQEPRFTSPGVVYVIALTAIDTTKLPTIRQTMALRFSKATLNPHQGELENFWWHVVSDTTTHASGTFVNLRNGNAARMRQVNSLNSNDMIISVPSITIQPGETMHIAVSYANAANLVWMATAHIPDILSSKAAPTYTFQYDAPPPNSWTNGLNLYRLTATSEALSVFLFKPIMSDDGVDHYYAVTIERAVTAMDEDSMPEAVALSRVVRDGVKLTYRSVHLPAPVAVRSSAAVVSSLVTEMKSNSNP